jgi:hypothetical protein
VILDDRYVSPEHIRVDIDDTGEWVAEDLGSLNGLFVHGSTERHERLVLRSGLKVQVGETVLRFVDVNELVPPAQAHPTTQGGFLHFLSYKRFSLPIILLSLASLTLDGYLELYQELKWVDLLGPAVGMLIVLAPWAGVWSFANRLLSPHFDFFRHLAFVFLMTVMVTFIDTLGEYFLFFASSVILLEICNYIIYGLWLMLLLIGHLSILPSITRWKRFAWALGVGVLVMSFAWLSQLAERSGFSTAIQTNTPLKTFGADWLPATTVEEFMEESRTLRDEIDELARKD